MLPDLKRPDIKNPEKRSVKFCNLWADDRFDSATDTHTLPEALHFPFYCLTLTIVRQGRTPITNADHALNRLHGEGRCSCYFVGKDGGHIF